jgi:hypothetical protein
MVRAGGQRVAEAVITTFRGPNPASLRNSADDSSYTTRGSKSLGLARHPLRQWKKKSSLRESTTCVPT